MIVLENGHLLRGDATNATEVDFTVHGLDNNALKQLADGQLASSIGTLYTADSTDVVTAVILVNTGAAHNHVNLYLTPSGGTARRLIPKDLQLEVGYSLHFEGGKCLILTSAGAIAQTIDTTAFLDDTAGGTDALTTKAPTSNAFYDHTRLTAGASAHGLVAATDPGGAALLHVMASVNGAAAWSVQDIFDATAPSTQAIGDSASAGTAVTAAHRDHKHAMPSAATMDTASVAAVAAAGVVLADTKNIEFEATPSSTHTADGIVVTMTAGASLVFGDACYVGTDGKMEKALADDAAITIPATHLCIATIAENSAGLFLVKGWAHDDSWSFDVGKSVYLSAATAGLITKTMPTKVTGNQVQVLGTCLVADTIYWNPDMVVMEYA